MRLEVFLLVTDLPFFISHFFISFTMRTVLQKQYGKGAAMEMKIRLGDLPNYEKADTSNHGGEKHNLHNQSLIPYTYPPSAS